MPTADGKTLLIEVPERVVTPRLVLRVPRAGDGPTLNAAIVASFPDIQPWLPWADHVPSIDESEMVVRRQHAQFLLREDFVFQIWEHAGDGREHTLLGGTGLHRMDWTVPRFEIGYWRRTGHAKRGVISEAVIALTRLAFDQLHAERVEIRVDPENVASWRVAERVGYTLEGTLRRDRRNVSGSLRDTRVYSRVRGSEES
jgi:RimJ/RimL family protein N-acetyltransferase